MPGHQPERAGETRFENNYFTEMCSGSEAGSYLRLIDFVYHPTLGLRVIKKRRERRDLAPDWVELFVVLPQLARERSLDL